MRTSRLSRLILSIIVCAFSVALCLHSSGVQAAGPDCVTAGTTCPYFKVFGGDVFMGGAFNTVADSTNCTTTGTPGYYQSNTVTAGAGGIYAFSKDNGQNSNGGSSGQYGVFALGPIEGNSAAATPYGFYSAGSQANGVGNTKKDYTTFSNTVGAPSWGGNFDGSGGANLNHCISDYYDMKNNAAIAGFPGMAAATADQYSVSGAPYVLNGGTVDKKLTLFISGSVYINSDITYSYSDDTHVPKFALVVKGNIYVAPSVHRLDGLYIAQPTTTVSLDGIMWSCHDSDPTNNLSVWFNNNCNSKLTINGAVMAKQLNLMRENGHIASASSAEDVSCGAAAATQDQAQIDANCGNVAEVINYVPSMVIGGPFFNQKTKPLQVNSVVNLPPVF